MSIPYTELQEDHGSGFLTVEVTLAKVLLGSIFSLLPTPQARSVEAAMKDNSWLVSITYRLPLHCLIRALGSRNGLILVLPRADDYLLVGTQRWVFAHVMKCAPCLNMRDPTYIGFRFLLAER